MLSVFGLTGLVIVLSLVSNLPSTPQINHFDKFAHLVAYVSLGYGYLSLWPNQKRWIILGLILLGAGLEVAQGMGSHRHAEWADLVANGLGIFLSLLIVHLERQNLLAWLQRKAIS